jgi:prepilin-type N-terminal cleavage/methylation domain-containing protein
MNGARQRNERGFTLIELMISLMLFTVGILSLTATSAVVVRMMGGAREQTVAATLAQSRFERLRSVGCGTATFAGGSATTRGIAERWVVSTSTGANTAVSIRLLTDSVSYKTPRGVRRSVYVSQHTCT